MWFLSITMSVSLIMLISLENRRLQRALESKLPNYLSWWDELGPKAQGYDVYLRTAVDVNADGWANFDYVKMPEYRWGIFLNEPVPDRKIAFGDHKGDPVWQEVPGEYRSTLRRLIVTQGDTEPASVEQQRVLGQTAPSLYDLRNLFQINVEKAATYGPWFTCFTPISAAMVARKQK